MNSSATQTSRMAPGENRHAWSIRAGVWITGLSMLIPEIVGSTFNIAYNIVHIESLMKPNQLSIFFNTILAYNLTVYPLAIAVWIWILRSLSQPFSRLIKGEPVDEQSLAWARRTTINLPWYGVGIATVGWTLCVPVFLGVLRLSTDDLDPRIYTHLPISFSISALIAATHGFFLLEMLAQRLLYGVMFRDSQPADTPGARPLSLRGRGLLWVLSAGVCPIGSLLLLTMAPHDHDGVPWFALAVGGIGVVFGLTTAWLIGRWVTEPVDRLTSAARAVAAGDLSAHIDLQRADDFGPLIDEFNLMVSQLREKELLQETFGRHVGQRAAELILQRDPGLGGFEEIVTVLFVDIRNFTARCEQSTPQEVVVVLNQFLSEMVETIELNGGMVNKFLGDGLMAIFGLGDGHLGHADEAVASGQQMLTRLQSLNQRLESQGRQGLAIGVGLHTGPAIVGSIGSQRRMEFTAIGDTVNIASRVEGLTKDLGQSLLMTGATRDALRLEVKTEQLPPQKVKGQSEPLIVYCVTSQDNSGSEL